MFSEDMILGTGAPRSETPTQDSLGFLFVNAFLAIVLSAVAGFLLNRVSVEMDTPIGAGIVQALRSGVFTAILMARPFGPRGSARTPGTMVSYSIGGFILGLALQFFVITPLAVDGASILAYLLISLVLFPTWLFGKALGSFMARIGFKTPGTAFGALISGLAYLFRRRRKLDDSSDL